jgi:hypothetical protein
LDGKRIRHYLARVVEIGQPVDNGDASELRQVQHVLVRERARHDYVVEPGQHTRDVPGFFPSPEADVIGA